MIQFWFTLASRWSQPCTHAVGYLLRQREWAQSNDGGDNTSELVKSLRQCRLKYFSLPAAAFRLIILFLALLSSPDKTTQTHKHRKVHFNTTEFITRASFNGCNEINCLFPPIFRCGCGFYVRNMKTSDFDLHICARCCRTRIKFKWKSQPQIDNNTKYFSLCVFLGGVGVESLLVEKQFFPTRTYQLVILSLNNFHSLCVYDAAVPMESFSSQHTAQRTRTRFFDGIIFRSFSLLPSLTRGLFFMRKFK